MATGFKNSMTGTPIVLKYAVRGSTRTWVWTKAAEAAIAAAGTPAPKATFNPTLVSLPGLLSADSVFARHNTTDLAELLPFPAKALGCCGAIVLFVLAPRECCSEMILLLGRTRTADCVTAIFRVLIDGFIFLNT